MTESATAVPPSYFRAALSNQYNVILLAGSASFSAALASWAPLVSGLVGEALWLVTGPRWKAFQRHADALEVRASVAPPALAVPLEYVERSNNVQALLRRVEESWSSRSDVSVPERQELGRRLGTLMPAFADVCSTHQRLRRAAAQVPLGDLQTELASLHQALASETDLGVRASLRRGLTVAERRIKQLEGNETACRQIELAMQNFQQSLALLAEAAAGLSRAAELSAEIDNAASQLNRQAAADAERELALSMNRTLPPPLPPNSPN